MPLFVGKINGVRHRLRGSRHLNCGHRRLHRHPGEQNSHRGFRRWERSKCGLHPKAQSRYGHRLRTIRRWERAGA